MHRTITRAVLTVPAYFHDGQRLAVKQAAEQAGFRVERLLNEPLAAALAYHAAEDATGPIVVLNLTLFAIDVTILQAEEIGYTVLAASGAPIESGRTLDDTCGPAIHQTLSAARLDPSAIEGVFLAGSNPQLDEIRGIAERHFARPAQVAERPGEMVALGAALQGSKLAASPVPAVQDQPQHREPAHSGCFPAILFLLAAVSFTAWLFAA